MHRILNASSSSCVDYLKMRKFLPFGVIMRDGVLLRDSIHVQIEEKIAMFLYKVSHK